MKKVRNLPEVSYEAVMESYESFSKMVTSEDMEYIAKNLTTQRNKAVSRQPNILEFVVNICQNHKQITEGNMTTEHFIMYTLVIIDSFYRQNEIEDIRELFNKGE